MSVSLSYETTGPVSPATREAIEREAAAANASRVWWAEQIRFLRAREAAAPMRGTTKLFLPGYSTRDGGYTEVAIEDDSLMACRDALFILDLLAGWAGRFGVEWEVGVEGPIGLVTASGPDALILEALEMLASHAEFDLGDRAAIEERAAAISERYRSRLDE